MRDIRRTVATGLAELGPSPTIISKVLDHTLPGESTVTPIYSRYAFLDEKRQAVVGLTLIVGGKSNSNLVGNAVGNLDGTQPAAPTKT